MSGGGSNRKEEGASLGGLEVGCWGDDGGRLQRGFAVDLLGRISLGGPVSSKGSSVGLGGGIGSERSITGGSFLTVTASFVRRLGVRTTGDTMTSRGGEKTSAGGS